MRTVVALGGNALLRRGQELNAENQRENIRKAASELAVVHELHQLIIAHGNGPQVGLLALMDAHYTAVEPYPLDVLGAETVGMIGYMIEQEMGNLIPFKDHIVTVLTQVLVDPADPRVVPSPLPMRIIEMNVIRMLVDNNVVVICAGGGGIPTAYDENRKLYGVEAVIDKDLASGLLARGLDADMFVMLTDVASVYTGFGTENQRPIRAAHPDALEKLDFAAGSMGPKVKGACEFVRETGKQSAIGQLSDLAKIMDGKAGTLVSNQIQGIVYGDT